MNRRFLSRRAKRGLALGTAIGALVLAGAAPASASPVNPAPGLGLQPAHGNGHGGGPGGGGGSGGGGGGGGGSTTNGLDVSYPQCGSTTLPTSAAFVIVGVNGGLANDLNPCLGPSATYSLAQSELYWAGATTAGSTEASVAKIGLYVNTADPGNVYNNAPVADWPTSGGNATYGTCSTTTVKYHGKTESVGNNSDACAWQYGYNMAAQDAGWLTSAASGIDTPGSTVIVPSTPSDYTWWLDVETANTWQSDTSMNVADLEGMIAGLNASSVTNVGAYSTATQWNSIVGSSVTSSSAINGIPNWIPGATSLTGAEANCTTLTSFTSGVVSITQWTATLDNDYACP